ncbi:AraC family transcriptional regulator [Paenibacillus sp. 1001270B_150601_E10]|uniref:AraC family transcriptional regulator n=1 Tax=Paenibacillus sp. 1001270B_150601_E10 TaxID=2787079 RepID=UPI00189F8B0A|nr:helix-turn-helix domain-containing protein [Paenibacillus sp. 1001270B_150601_E10]
MFPNNLHGDDEIYGDFPFTLKIHQLPSSVPAHVHHFIEYTYAFHGRGTELVNGVARELVPGTFTLLFPHQVHEIRVEPGEELHLYVGAIGLKGFFGPDDSLYSLHRLLKDAENDSISTYKLDEAASCDIIKLLQEMHQEVLEEEPWHRMMFVAKLIQLFIVFDRYRKRTLESPADKRMIQGRGGMWQVIQYVYQNFKEDISLESLAQQFNYSPSYVSSAFKQMIGENFISFLERIRIAHAANLLIGTDMKITDIAFEAGFKSYSTFARVFQEHMKMSPTAYRKHEGIDTQEGTNGAQ